MLFRKKGTKYNGVFCALNDCPVANNSTIESNYIPVRSMEEDGIVTRTVYAEVPPRVEYALSELGNSLRPILDAMLEWGNTYKGAV